jgi:hypothetical protein
MNPIDINKIVEWFIGLGASGIALVITGVILGYLLSCRHIKQLKEDRKELHEEVDRLRIERNELRAELNRSEDEAEELRNEVERLEERVKHLTKRVRCLEEYIHVNINQQPPLPPPDLPPIQPAPETTEQPSLQPTQLQPVKSKEEIATNLSVFDGYLNQKSTTHHSFAEEKMRFGKCFVATQSDGRWLFAPSKFVGYARNSKECYEANIEDIDGRESNKAIEKVLGITCETDNNLNEAFQNYCQSKGVTVSDKQRKYWKVLTGLRER